MAAFAHPENPAGLVERSGIGRNLYGNHRHIVNYHSGWTSANETDLRPNQPGCSENGINRLVGLGKADGATSTIFNAKQNRAALACVGHAADAFGKLAGSRGL